MCYHNSGLPLKLSVAQAKAATSMAKGRALSTSVEAGLAWIVIVNVSPPSRGTALVCSSTAQLQRTEWVGLMPSANLHGGGGLCLCSVFVRELEQCTNDSLFVCLFLCTLTSSLR